jgi:deoxycytidine triphosphate deaminase
MNKNVSLLSTEDLKSIITRKDGAELALTQHGCDLHLKSVEGVGYGGLIPKSGNTTLPAYHSVLVDRNGVVEFERGRSYSVTFEEGCDIPNNAMLLIRQRSSLLRMGGVISSSLFDAGFKTDNMGTVLVANADFEVEIGARIAQVYGHSCEPVENLYDGQWAGDSWRNKDESKSGIPELSASETPITDSSKDIIINEVSTPITTPTFDGMGAIEPVVSDAENAIITPEQSIEVFDAMGNVEPIVSKNPTSVVEQVSTTTTENN